MPYKKAVWWTENKEGEPLVLIFKKPVTRKQMEEWKKENET